MQIIVATGTYEPEVSGQATFAFNLVRELSARHTVHVVTFANQDSENEHESITKIPRTSVRHVAYAAAIRRLARRGAIIYAQDLFSSGLPAAASRRDARLVVRLGGDFLWEKAVSSGWSRNALSDYYAANKNAIERLYLGAYRFVLKRAHHIVFNSQWLQDIYASKFAKYKTAQSVIPNAYSVGTSSVAFAPSSDIIFAGRFLRIKNLDALITAFRRVHLNSRLHLIGDGPDRLRLLTLAQKDQRIHFYGPMRTGELRVKLARCSLAVIPSISEVMPNFALEALSAGVPVLLTRSNGLPQALRDLCIEFDPRSDLELEGGIRRLADEQANLRQRTLIASSRLSYTWEEIARAHEKLFEDLLS